MAPHPPTSSKHLNVGDFWAVPVPSGRVGCVQVVELAQSGPGSRSTLMAGIIDWVGDSPPSATDITGRQVIDVGLTTMEVFTETGARVLGNAPVDRSANSIPTTGTIT